MSDPITSTAPRVTLRIPVHYLPGVYQAVTACLDRFSDQQRRTPFAVQLEEVQTLLREAYEKCEAA